MTLGRSGLADKVVGVLGGLGLVVAATGCSSSGGSDGRVSVAAVADAQQHMTDGGPCPFKIDLADALRRAGVQADVAPGEPAADGAFHPAEPGPAPSGPAASPMPGAPPYTAIECSYRVADKPVLLTVVATEADKTARNILLPQIAAADELSIGSEPFLTWVRTTPKPDEVVMPPGGDNAAIVRIPVKGHGDVALFVRVDEGYVPQPPKLAGDILRKITDRLKADIRL